MVSRVVVGAHYGLRGWLVQRVTGVVVAAYAVFLVLLVLANPVADHASWRALFAPNWVRIPTLVALLCVFMHAWVGMRDILMDYIKPTGLRLALEIAVIFALVGYAAWSAQILWSL